MKTIYLLLCLNMAQGSCVDYRTQGWMNYSKFVSGLPVDNVYTYTPLPTGLTPCDLEYLHNSCVNRINKYRSGELKFTGGGPDPAAPPLLHYTKNNRCANALSLGDFFVNDGQGICAGAHVNAFACPVPGNSGQNTCCKRSGTSVASIEATMFNCLQAMWDEGIGQPNNPAWSPPIGHWLNMRSTSSNSVSCGFSFRTDGGVWMNQDFFYSVAAQGCNCTNVPVGSNDGCGGVCTGNGSTAATSKAPTTLTLISKAPTTLTPTSKAPTTVTSATLAPTPRPWSTFPCYFFSGTMEYLFPGNCP